MITGLFIGAGAIMELIMFIYVYYLYHAHAMEMILKKSFVMGSGGTFKADSYFLTISDSYIVPVLN